MGNFIEMSGMRFGSLVVIGFADKSPSGALRWNCKCDCGNESKAFWLPDLEAVELRACGCSQVKRMRERARRKGNTACPTQKKSPHGDTRTIDAQTKRMRSTKTTADAE